MSHYFVNTFKAIVISFSALMLVACTSSSVDLQALQDAEITNFRAPEANILSSGQPTQEQLAVMAASGVRHVVNLRTEGEQVDFDEQQAVESLGMNYYSLPVAGAGGINGSNAGSLLGILAATAGEPVLIHCATGNRVGGLMAVSHFANSANVDAAMAEGERWGMTSERLQQAIRQSLSAE